MTQITKNECPESLNQNLDRWGMTPHEYTDELCERYIATRIAIDMPWRSAHISLNFSPDVGPLSLLLPFSARFCVSSNSGEVPEATVKGSTKVCEEAERTLQIVVFLCECPAKVPRAWSPFPESALASHYPRVLRLLISPAPPNGAIKVYGPVPAPQQKLINLDLVNIDLQAVKHFDSVLLEHDRLGHHTTRAQLA